MSTLAAPLAQVHPAPLAGAVALVLLLWWRRGHLEPTLVAGGVLGVIVLSLFGTGIVEIPNIKKLIEDLSSALGGWTYLVVGAMAFFETGAFVGLIAPGETFMLLGGVVAGQGEVSLIALIAIGWSCAVAGDAASFYAGHKLGRGFLERHGPKVSITKERLATVDGFFDNHGGKAVFLGRFVGLVRAVNPFLAGASGMPFKRFFPYSVLGAGMWASSLLVLGYVFWQSFDRVVQWAERGALALGSTVTIIIAGIWLYRYLRVRENRDELAAWVSRTLDRPMFRPVAFVVRPIWRRTWTIRHWLAGRLTPGDLGLEVTTLLAVLAVGGFFFLGNAIELRTAILMPGDLKAFSFADSITSDWLTSVNKVVTGFGSSAVLIPMLVIATALLLQRRMVHEALALAAGSILIWIAVPVSKSIVDRPRPVDSLIETAGSSYPSGHAAHGMAWLAVAVLAARALGGIARPAAVVIVGAVIASAIALSRVYLHAHYFSDVVGGVGLGAAIYALCGLVAVFVVHLRQNGRRSSE